MFLKRQVEKADLDLGQLLLGEPQVLLRLSHLLALRIHCSCHTAVQAQMA